ncbi:hypothetical protein RhiirC2_774496 [Rhizophagus irregularis]|uniref:F-box domain-containing protein n=1 Tax=Rhizophagus irregularis TaxID=588596 RepID=A0A2N1NL63_9GLOM|nr:hypothetical protein RhiirC2_774496 [Rhizophagus irregularis]
MSCSKVFSGNFPELIYNITKYFQNDISTLHSCILVNREWCRLVIPLLWENPFSTRTKNYNFIKFYLQNLDDDLKKKLNIYNIDKLLPSNTLFNYICFIRYLNIWKMISSINIWIKDVLRILKPINRNESGLRKLIQTLLFKILIGNEVNLHTLDIVIFSISNYKSYYYDIFEIILQNPNFIINNVRNLNLSIGVSSSRYSNRNNSDKYITESFPLYKSLLLSKDYNCSNTLNTIIFFRVNLNSITNLDKVFEQLNVLKSVHIIYCCSLKSSFIQQIINLTKPFLLKTLFIEKSEILQINSLELLLQKSGVYLESFEYLKFDINQQLIELIEKYCGNIKNLYLYTSRYHIISSVLNLIENIKQNLNYLSIHSFDESISGIRCSSTILRNLGQILPLELEYLNLILNIAVSDFKIFLENIQNTFISKLLIKNMIHIDNYYDILFCIKDYTKYNSI